MFKIVKNYFNRGYSEQNSIQPIDPLTKHSMSKAC
jgi:hypothetical protein